MHRPSRPSVSKTDVHSSAAIMDIDRRQTIRELERETEFSHTIVLQILKERLGMRKIASRWVPYHLTETQIWLQYDTAQTYLKHYEREGEAFLHRIIKLDETWDRSYQPKLKRQSNEWRHYGSPRSSKFRQNPSSMKFMVIIVYDCVGVILMHIIPPKPTVNAHNYCSVLEHHLRPALRKKKWRYFLQNAPIILHNNVRSHAE